METKIKTELSKNLTNKTIHISRAFNYPIKTVWNAYTKSELLDKWWAPKPWKAETKSINFKVGGIWLYAMVGPDGEKYWAKASYTEINPLVNFEVLDGFCDEHGNTNIELPQTKRNIMFNETPQGTRVEMDLYFATEKDLNTIVEMGFEEGMSMALDNLEELLKD